VSRRLVARVVARVVAQWQRTPWDLYANGLVQWPVVPSALRWRMLRAAGVDLQPCMISNGTFFGSRRLHVGRGAFLNWGTFIDGSDDVHIGDEAYLAMNVSIITSSHEIGPSRRRAGRLVTAPVTVGAGAWLGSGVQVLPGVTVGAGAVVLSGAVVTEDCAPDWMHGGVPCRPIRALEPDEVGARAAEVAS